MTLVVLPRQLVVDANGTPRIGAKLYVFDATTTTPRVTYTTASFGQAHQHPVESVSDGRFPAVYVNPAGGPYKIVLQDSAGASISTDDNIPAVSMTQAEIGVTIWPRTTAEISAGVTPSNYAYMELDVRRYGYVANDSTNNATALSNANLVATQLGGAEIRLPGGTGRITSSFTLSEGNSLVGTGYGTVLHCVACSVVIDAATANTTVQWCSLQQLALKRTSTAGPVIDLISDHVASANDFVANVVFDRVRILESTGDGLRVRGIVGLDCYSFQAEDCAGKGVRFEGNDANADVNNCIRFFGGNILRCDVGVWMVSAQNALFYGTVIENCTNGGMDVTRNCGRVVLSGMWFEANGDFDVRVGVDTASGDSHILRLTGCHFVDGVAAKANAIELIIAKEVFIDSCKFNGYGTEAILNDPFANGSVTGRIGNLNELQSTASICTGQTSFFYQHKAEGGSFVGTLTGVDSAVTGTVIYDINGKTVTVHVPQFSGTSNATTKTITGAPAAIQPSVQQYFPVRASDNGGANVWGTGRVETSGVITLFPLASGGNWTGSGTMTMNATALTWYLP